MDEATNTKIEDISKRFAEQGFMAAVEDLTLLIRKNSDAQNDPRVKNLLADGPLQQWMLSGKSNEFFADFDKRHPTTKWSPP